MNEDNINSVAHAKSFLNDKFGEASYHSRPEDLTDVTEYLDSIQEELEELQRYINRVENPDNLNHYKLNRSISLYFIVKAGDSYLELLHEVVNSMYEKELETCDSIFEPDELEDFYDRN